MSDPLERYGQLAPPPARRQLTIRESPLAALRAVYALWLDAVRAAGPFSIHDKDRREAVYRDAVAALQTRALDLDRGRHPDLPRMLETIRPGDSEASGLFLSALLNVSDLPELDGVFHHRILGYRLEADRRLVVRRGSQVDFLGPHAAGVLLNFGECQHLGYYADAGLVVNWGEVKWDMAWSACGGIQVNLGKVAENLGLEAHGGIQISVGDVKHMACDSAGLQVNGSTGTWTVNAPAAGAMQLHYHGDPHYNSRHFAPDKRRRARQHYRDLAAALDALSFLRTLTGRPEKLAWQLRHFPWEDFSASLRQGCRQVRSSLGFSDRQIREHRAEP